MDMCPTKERLFREEHKDLAVFEMVAGTEHDSLPRVDHTKAVKVCMYVCMYVMCMCTIAYLEWKGCIYIYIYVCVCVCVCVCMCICMHLCVCVCMCVCVYVYLHIV